MDDFFDFPRNFDLGSLPSDGTATTRNNFLQAELVENDIYKFDLSETSSLNFSLNIADPFDAATFGFFRDTNNNDQLDPDDLAITTNEVRGNFSFSNSPNSPDTYFAGVSYTDGGSDNRLDYELGLSAQSNGGSIPGELLNTPIYRFQSTITPSTYLYVGEEERQNINQNFADNFTEEGIAFNAAVEPDDELIALYRFQNTQRPGTYLFVGEGERNNIITDPNLSNTFNEEGIAFFVYSAGAGEETPFFRFQNSLIPGTYIYAAGLEADIIRTSLMNNFNEEGIAFEARI